MSKDHITYLDGWRGLAIITVLIGHFTPVPGVNLGPLGVELFFVLSGRLMAEMLIVRQTPFATFFWRRFSRIYPALIVFCVAMLVASALAQLVGIKLPSSVGMIEFFAAILFVMNYAAAFFGLQGVLDHIWSLSVEEHSYALLALVSLLMVRNRQRSAIFALVVALLMMCSGIAQALLTDLSEHDLYWRTDVRAASVFLAFSLYLLIDPRNAAAPKFAKWVAPTALLIACVLNFDVFPVWLKYSLGTALLAIAISTLDWSVAPFRAVLSGRVIVYVGLLSYSLYLWQQPFYRVIAYIGWAPALIGVIVVSFGSYLFIEKPSRKALNAFWERRSSSGEKLGVQPAST